MEELKAYLYVERPFRLTSKRTARLFLVPLLSLLLCAGAMYYVYTMDAQLAQRVLPILAVWSVVTYGLIVPLIWLSHMTIDGETLCVRVCGVFTKKYSKDDITRVWKENGQIIIGLRGNRRLSLLDSTNARKILERLRVPIG